MLTRLKDMITKAMILLIIYYLNFVAKIKSCFHAQRILLATPYQGQKILLIALYEKGVLRNDIQRLLTLAKKKGLYIIGVNTQRLQQGADLSKHFDCYIEKHNFGRDFGSYKTGFSYFYQHQMEQSCPRLLMLNDSVFYESKRSDAFLDTLIHSNIEVLGATENFELEYHIGSFCISFDSAILTHPSFKKFWLNYTNTNIRPLTIKKGEMGLSKLLVNITSSTSQMQSFYDVMMLTRKLDSDPEVLERAISLSLKPVVSALGKGLSANNLLTHFIKINYPLFTDCISVNLPQECTLNALLTYLRTDLNIKDEHLEAKLITFLKASITNRFCIGSQIHNNAELLLCLGLPLIKLDLNFRGVLTTYDIMTLSALLEPLESVELQNILLKRIHYRKIASQWHRTLADKGFI